MGVPSAAEIGANVGGDWELRRHTDVGAAADIPFSVKRANGRVTIGDLDGSQTGLDVNRNGPGLALQVNTNYAGACAAIGIGYKAFDAISRIVQSAITVDGNFRFVAFADGKQEWGAGAAGRDVNLYRKAVDQLATDDALFLATQTAAQITALGIPVAGGYLFVDAGALKYKGASGTVTTIGPA